ncbi:MAG: glycosyltransferase family 4 protein [Chloroflexi bacterium]|nr:glycosyltransferase family 4 protein [Chloroflexota bacterium]
MIDHYLPGTRSGGPVRTISNLVEALGDVIEFKIITRDRDLGDSKPYDSAGLSRWQRLGRSSVLYLPPRDLVPWRIVNHIRATTHDVILLNGVFPPSVLSVLWGRRFFWSTVPVVVAPRGHLETGALSLKSRKKRLFLLAARTLGIYSNVLWLCASESERQDVIREFGTRVRPRIVVIPNFAWKAPEAKIVGRSQKIKGALRVVFLSRVSRKKNLTLALDVLSSVAGNIQFDLYGPIEDETYWSECREMIKRLPAGVVVNHRGSVEPDKVGTVLAQYDLFILPTLGENFGHAILEALSAGCPVLISDRTPWNDVNQHGAGWALPLNQPEKFREVVQMLVDADDETMSKYRQNALNYAADYLAKSTAVDDMRKFLLEVAASGRQS